MADPRPRPASPRRATDYRADGLGPRRPGHRRPCPKAQAKKTLALAMAKAIARRAVLDWEGVGDDTGQPLPASPEGIDALLEIWPVFEAFQTHVCRQRPDPRRRKKRLRALAEWSFGGGERYCAACEARCPDCPARLNRPQTYGWLAGLGSGRPPWRTASGQSRRGAWLGHGGGIRHGAGAGREHADCGRTAARNRGGDGAQIERTDGRRWLQRQALIFSIRVTPGRSLKWASQVRSVAPRDRAVANMIASAVASLWPRQASAAARAISVSRDTT